MSTKEARAMDRLTWILTEDELLRFAFIGGANGLVLQVDLHNLPCREAYRLVRNAIALVRDEFELVIIHGYRHGQALRDMFRRDFESERVAARRGDARNPGVTRFQVAA